MISLQGGEEDVTEENQPGESNRKTETPHTSASDSQSMKPSSVWNADNNERKVRNITLTQ